MLTKIKIKNFKVFEDVEIELDNPVVFIGPNNSGKTTALQALSLWEIGLKRWVEKRGGKIIPKERKGVTIYRPELVSLPVDMAKVLWHKLHVRELSFDDGRQKTKNVFITICVEGITNNEEWQFGLDFYYSNDQVFYCRPIATEHGVMKVPSGLENLRVFFLPPMSGLATVERRIDSGAINVLIGEGRTAEVLRNLCYRALHPDGNPQIEDKNKWEKLVDYMRSLFGINLLEPQYIAARGEISMSYKDESGIRLPLSAVGRGTQQILLILAYMFAHPDAIILIDEPDAHLEMLRQRQIYKTITEVALEQNNQLIIATHSEVVLDEAAGKDKVIAFVGKPHSITDKGSQARKALTTVGWDQYYQAEQKKWVLYLEGSTDLSTLQAFAKKLEHPVQQYLERPFVRYIANQPQKAKEHFYALKEAVSDLKGIALLDNLDNIPAESPGIEWLMWERKEIENYFCSPNVLRRFARGTKQGNLFAQNYERKMTEIIEDEIPPAALRNENHDWWKNVKASDDFLDKIFKRYSEEMKVSIPLRKGEYYRLIHFLKPDEILPEVKEKLDAILSVAQEAEKA